MLAAEEGAAAPVAGPRGVRQNALSKLAAPASTTPVAMQIMQMGTGGWEKKSLQVSPGSVFFEDVRPGLLYMLTFSVRNVGDRGQRIRVSPPQTPWFELSFPNKGVVAPGLDVRGQITFRLPEPEQEEERASSPLPYEFVDRLVVKAEGQAVEVPLFARRPIPEVALDREFVNFGAVLEGQLIERNIVLSNVGPISSRFSFVDSGEGPLLITPREGVLGPGRAYRNQEGSSILSAGTPHVVDDSASGSSPLEDLTLSQRASVTITFDATAWPLGKPFRQVLALQVEPLEGGWGKEACGVAEAAPRMIDVSAVVMQQQLRLVMGDGSPDGTVTFGTRHYGSVLEQSATLYNDGPRPATFITCLEGEDDGDGLLDEAAADHANPFSIEPRDGIISPHCSTQVLLRFAPREVAPKAGFKTLLPPAERCREYCASLAIELAEGGTGGVAVSVTGKGVPQGLSVSEHQIEFGNCPCGDHRDALLQVKCEGELPIKYFTSLPPQFQCRPALGELAPGQSTQVIVSYMPRQMGPAGGALRLTSGGEEVAVLLVGNGVAGEEYGASTKGAAPEWEGDVPLKFVVPETEVGKYQAWRRPRPYESINFNTSCSWDESMGSPLDPMLAKWTFSAQELARREAHKEQYADWLVRCAAERKASSAARDFQRQTLLAKRDPSDPELGPECGFERWLPSEVPEPRLPDPSKEPLFLHSAAGHRTGGGAGGKRCGADISPTKLITKKFGAEPTTQAEVRDCSKKLEREQRSSVVRHFATLEFGEVVVGSTASRNAAFTNGLAQSIRIELDPSGLEAPEIRTSWPRSQIVPSGATAGFDIAFRTDAERSFRRTLAYSINGTIAGKFVVAAEAVQARLLAAPSSLSFEFGSDDLTPTLSQSLTLTNPGNAPCLFKVASLAGTGYSVEPGMGELKPGEAATLAVTWAPQPGLKGRHEISISVADGAGEEVKIPVEAILEDGRCKLVVEGGEHQQHSGIEKGAESACHFGTLAVGSRRTVRAKLVNTGQTFATFFVDNAALESVGVSVMPMVGRIAPASSAEVQLTFNPQKITDLTGRQVSVVVRGLRPMRLPLAGCAVVPELSYVDDGAESCILDLGSVTVGSASALPVAIRNGSDTATCALVLDLTGHAEWHLAEKDKDAPSQGQSEATYVESIKGKATQSVTEIPPSRTSSTASLAGRALGGQYDPIVRQWRLVIAPGGTVNFQILFEPGTAGDHSFQLPISMEGCPRPKAATHPLSRLVKGTATQPTLSLDPLELEFGDRIVSRDPAMLMPYPGEVRFTNQSAGGLTWQLDDSALQSDPDRPFFVSPVRGNLGGGESTTLRVTFTPKQDSDYSFLLPIHVSAITREDEGQREEDTTLDRKPYLYLALGGSGLYPRLSFSTEVACLPTVPLGVTSKVAFQVFNQGFADMELTHRLPQHCPVSIAVHFPDGKRLGLTKPSLTVEVSFRTDEPVSFTAVLDIFDADGGRYPVLLQGCSDNSLLTSWPFVASTISTHSLLAQPGSPVMLVTNDYMKRRRSSGVGNKRISISGSSRRSFTRDRAPSGAAPAQGPPRVGAGGSIQLSPGAAAVYQRVSAPSARLLAAWLSANACPSSPIKEFPMSIIESDGRLALEAIEKMSGKQIPGQSWRRLQSQARIPWENRCTMLQEQYSAMLRFLKERGSLLSVSPVDLLDRDMCLRAKRDSHLEKGQRITPKQVADLEMKWATEYEETSRTAWAAVMYQSIRVFMLARITSKLLESHPQLESGDHGKKSQGSREPLGSSVHGSKGRLRTVLPDPELAGSNIYSVGEGVLLRWMSRHLKKDVVTPRLRDFAGEVANARVLCQVIGSHTPHLAAPGGALHGYMLVATGPSGELDFTPEAAAKMGWTDLQRSSSHLALSKADLAAGISPDAARAINAMDALHMSLGPGLSPADLCTATPNGRDMVLVAMHLFQQLPHLIPRAEIQFAATLGEACRKCIELRNPTTVPLLYTAQLEGPNAVDFSIPSGAVVSLEPSAAVEFPVEIFPRFTAPAQARLTLWAQHSACSSDAPAAPVVFSLRATVRSVRPTAVHLHNAGCYLLSSAEIELKNPFHVSPKAADDAAAAEFMVLLKQERIDDEPATAPPGASASEAEREAHRVLSHPMHCSHLAVSIPHGGSARLPLLCLPFSPGTFKCTVMLHNDELGEFAHEITVEVSPPEPEHELNLRIASDDSARTITKELRFPARNTTMMNAVAILLERYHGEKKSKLREAVMRTLQPPTGDPLFYVHADNPYFKLSTASARASQTCKGFELVPVPDDVSSPAQSLLLSLTPSEAGTYPCTVTLITARPPAADMRRITITAVVDPPAISTALHFRCPAGRKVTQAVPVRNSSSMPWTLMASPRPPPFSGPPSLHVPAGSSASYPLTFAPERGGTAQQEVSGMLILSDSTHHASIKFELKGFTDPPLAEDHIVHQCCARQRSEHTFALSNESARPLEYSVTSDLPGTSGPPAVTVAPKSEATYTMAICPPVGGTFTGSVTFTAADGRMQWYTCTLQVGSPDSEGTITLESRLRQAVSAEISLTNPLDEELEFSVILEGEGLMGESTMVMGPHQTGEYILYYSPLRSQHHTGGVRFISPLVGEFWHRLDLTALPAEPIELDLISCPVGDAARISVPIENPIGQQITLLSVAAPADEVQGGGGNFTLEQESLSIPAYGSVNATIVYCPSSLTEEERGQVRLMHPELGEWVFLLKGRGSLPGVMAEQRLECVVDSNASHMFAFRNPFPSSILLEIVMQAPPELQLMLKRSKELVLAPRASLHIPICFTPTKIRQCEGTIEVRGQLQGRHLTWVYPVKGVAEAPSVMRAVVLTVPAKEATHQDVRLTLDGVESLEGEEFSMELIIPEDCRRVAERALTVTQLQPTLSAGCASLRFDFEPLTPFATTAELIIVRGRDGGRWRYEVELHASDPKPDDTIRIQAGVGSTSSVTFRLCNRYLSHAHYSAYFTRDSALSLSVEPSDGVLLPFGSEGTAFTVSYKPTEYSHSHRGRLVIQTADVQWAYEVVGAFPTVQLPSNVQPRVNSHIDPHIAQKLGRAKMTTTTTKKKEKKNESRVHQFSS